MDLDSNDIAKRLIEEEQFDVNGTEESSSDSIIPVWKEGNPSKHASWLSRLFFYWVNPLISVSLIYRSVLFCWTFTS